MNVLRTLVLAFVLTMVPATGPSAKAPRPAPSAPLSSVSGTSGVGSDGCDDPDAGARDEVHAQRVLDGLAASYCHLEGVRVRVGATPNDEEAVSYYTEGEIVINRAHTVGIETILAHEVWHIVDWRDNGQIDWGEDIPPSNADTYALR